MDQLRFNEACKKIIGIPRERNSIGTIGEKTLHAVLKEYFEPYCESREVKIGGYVCDIVGENGVMEIQTGDLGRLGKKLETLLEFCSVTVVYPMAAVKNLMWLNEETGELSKKRRSPRKMTVWDGIAELYRIKSLLNSERLRICLCLMEINEIRLLNGWSQDGKKGSSRFDRIPVRILEEIYISCSDDYKMLLTDAVSETFTSRDLAEAFNINIRTARTALNVLTYTHAVRRTGRQGNTIIYEKL